MTILSGAEAKVQLETLASGLLFTSESDFPLTVVSAGSHAALDAPTLLVAVGKLPTSAVEEVTVADFFGYAAEPQAFHTAQDRLTVARYQALLAFLSTALAAARVYRIGEIDIDVYALGKSADGEWLGVATKLVET